jgi:4-amino-4-deoxy-L-arabinose transferase-like glycosyltransferase
LLARRLAYKGSGVTQVKTRHFIIPDKQQTKPQAALRAELGKFLPALLAVLLGALSLYAALSITWIKFSRAEVFFAECAREMIVHNNMVTPLYHGQPFFDKPILSYWFILALFQKFGASHLAARIPSMVAALVTITASAFSAYAIAQHKRKQAGLIAAMVLASSFMFLSFACLCMSDMLLVMFDTATMVALFAATLAEKRRTLMFFLASLTMGLAFLTKGPVGIVLPAVAFLSYLGLTRQFSIVRPLHVAIGAATIALIGVPWFYAAYKANGSGALVYFFIRENLQRFAGSTYDTHKPVWFMLVSLAGGFLPWSIFLPPAVVQFVGQIKKDNLFKQPAAAGFDLKAKLYLWLWAATVTLFFSFSRGKCDYYVLPAYPALALIAGLYITDSRDNEKISARLAILMASLFVASGVVLPMFLRGAFATMSPLSWYLMPLPLVAAGCAAGVLARAGLLTHAVTCLYFGIIAAGLAFSTQLLPSIVEMQSLDRYAAAIRRMPQNARIAIGAGQAHWIDELTFQSGRELSVLSQPRQLSEFLASPGPQLAIVPDSLLKDCQSSPAVKDATVVDRRLVSTHPLTPGYFLSRHGRLADTTLLILSKQK